jgi:hypothetical protein
MCNTVLFINETSRAEWQIDFTVLDIRPWLASLLLTASVVSLTVYGSLAQGPEFGGKYVGFSGNV